MTKLFDLSLSTASWMFAFAVVVGCAGSEVGGAGSGTGTGGGRGSAGTTGAGGRAGAAGSAGTTGSAGAAGRGGTTGSAGTTGAAGTTGTGGTAVPNEIWVAPTGLDTNPGTMASPMKTVCDTVNKVGACYKLCPSSYSC